MNRKLLLFLLTVIFGMSWFNANAQIGIRTSYIKHSGDMGYLVKPSIGYELIGGGYNIANKFYYGGSIGFFLLDTRLDTVPIGTFLDDDGVTLLPSYCIYDNMVEFTVGFNFEYKFLDKKFSPVIGTDIYFHVIEYDYIYHVPMIGGSDVTNKNIVTMGIIPRLGVVYDLTDNITLEAGIGKSIAIDNTYEKYQYWKTYIGAVYFFNR